VNPFVQAMQKRVAEDAIGVSTVRRHGSKGTAEAAKRFLADVSLQQFVALDEGSFHDVLDETTDQLMRFLPKHSRSWGLARKCLNIFLRDALYNVYLRNEYGLSKAEQWCEVPLDGKVAKKLRRAAGRGVLPKWDGVKRLDPMDSAIYQKFAQDFALEMGIARVHLDLYRWRTEAEPPNQRELQITQPDDDASPPPSSISPPQALDPPTDKGKKKNRGSSLDQGR